MATIEPDSNADDPAAKSSRAEPSATPGRGAALWRPTAGGRASECGLLRRRERRRGLGSVVVPAHHLLMGMTFSTFEIGERRSSAVDNRCRCTPAPISGAWTVWG